MIIYIIATLFVLWCAYYYQKNKRTWELAGRLPGPKTLPLIGNAHLFRGGPHGIFLAVKKIAENKEYGDVIRLFLGDELMIFIQGVKEVEEVLSSQKLINKSEEYEFLKPWLGTGLLISSGKKWHSRRKIITPTFHFKILEQFISVFDEQSSTLIKQLQKHANTDKEFDIYDYITLCALDVICESAMGVSVNAQTEDSEYIKAVKTISLVVHKRMFGLWERFDWMFALSQDYQVQKHALQVLHGETDRVIRERREQVKHKEQQVLVDDLGIKKKMAFLDLLLQATIDGEPLSDESIREEVDTFMFEGHDTTTSGIAFALYCLAENPDVQSKLFQEIQEIFGDDKTIAATFADLQNMKYLDLVIKETLRLYPSVPLFGRKMTSEVTINGHIIPQNANLTIGVYFMNRRADVFPDPEKFYPERFLTEDTSRNPYAYVPFSAGPRNCIGQKFAVLEMKSVISKMIRHFELVSSGHEPKLSLDLILKSLNGVRLKLKSRKY